MSTMQEKFEAMLVLYRPHAEMMTFENSEGVPEYWNPIESLAWKMWQAATEAAKATGTAGELSESQKIAMQYGQQLNDAEATAFVSGIELGKELAARQPAPVVAVKTWQERMKTTTLTWKTGDGKLAAEFQLMSDEIADLRAALAATNRSQPAQVLARMVDIDEVKQLCRDYSSRTGSVYIGDVEATLDALAARSQP